MTITSDIGLPVSLSPKLHDSYYLQLYKLIENKQSLDEVTQALLDWVTNLVIDNPLDHIEAYRKLLALLITLEIIKNESEEMKTIATLLKNKIDSVKTWREFQLVLVYQKLCSELCGISDGVSLNIRTEKEGYAQLEYGRHWSWAGIPLQPYHTELGVILALLGIHTNHEAYISVANQIALFQLHLLDNEHYPIPGIFTQERDAGFIDLLAWSAILFHSVSRASQNGELLGISEIQKESLKDLSQQVHPLIPLIFKWKPFGKSLNQHLTPIIPQSFKITSLGAYGKRSEEQITISTLFGGRTGLGTYHVNRNLSIVTFGPQYQPYGDCRGFGVELNSQSQNKFPNVSFEERTNGYITKGYTKVVGKTISETTYSCWGNSEHSEIWLDISQELSDRVLNLDVKYLTYPSENQLSFVFYIKAEQCEIRRA
ncbi:MAG: hypothetical protein AAGG81_08250, partial [Chlamydiota bacterium]